jgi:hypothetical protein
MTANGRPNLAGLFSGTVVADRPADVAGAPGPRLVLSPPIAAPDPEPEPRADAASPAPEPQIHTAAAGTPHRRSALAWLDPVNAMELYFQFLQTLLDANRGFAVGWARTVKSLPEHLRTR